MLNAEGNAFTASMCDRYLEMFESRALAEVNRPFLRRLGFGPVLTAYHVDPGWLTYDVVAPKIDELYREWSSTRSSDWMRNYGAMGDEKLLRCLDELRHEEGEAFDRVIERGGDVARNRVAAEAAARERGLI